MNFKELGISQERVNKLNSQGIKNPTPIQSKCIPTIMEGKDLIAEAATGTGKTLSFLLPVFENVNSKAKDIQVLILTPTRELALQITKEAEKLKEGTEINILAAYGGKDIGSQLNKLKGNIHIVIATPGRLLDHLARKTISLSNLKTFILDEADQMLLMGFKNDVEDIKKMCPKKHQTLCFSATMDSQVKKLAYRYMPAPAIITIEKSSVTLDNIKQEVVETTDRWKQASLKKALSEDNPFMGLIFCRTKRRADDLELGLAQAGYNVAKLHSDVPQNKRERIMKSFRDAKIQYLIATDVASRGIDITGVSHIYNYDIPETVEAYIHRIGRTGRAGEEGYTCLFVAPKDKALLNQIESRIKMKLSRREICL